MANTYTREQFYELVWSKPMTHLAKEFTLSDVALHKICKKHDIPKPPVGWWAKKAAGPKVKVAVLPKAKTGLADRITIVGGELRNESTSLAVVREEARMLASDGGTDQSLSLHPIIERTLKKLTKAKAQENGTVTADGAGFIKCEISPGLVPVSCRSPISLCHLGFERERADAAQI